MPQAGRPTQLQLRCILTPKISRWEDSDCPVVSISLGATRETGAQLRSMISTGGVWQIRLPAPSEFVGGSPAQTYLLNVCSVPVDPTSHFCHFHRRSSVHRTPWKAGTYDSIQKGLEVEAGSVSQASAGWLGLASISLAIGKSDFAVGHQRGRR